jgi:ribosome-associated protein
MGSMTVEDLQIRNIDKEFIFSYTRSSGPGGQNVNKVNTRVELRFNVITSYCLGQNEKELVQKKLHKKINSEGELIMVSQSERSQLRNRKNAMEKFFLLLARALTPPKIRKPTAPTNASREKRLESKRITSEKKQIRRKTDL